MLLSYQGMIMLHGIRSQKVNVVKVTHKQSKEKMAEQVMNKVIMKDVAEAMRIAIQTMAKMQTQRVPNAAGPKLGSPTLKQPNFNWEVPDKYTDWKAFIPEVRNVLATYNAQVADKIAMVKNWLGRKGLHYIETLTENEKEACSTLQGLFNMLATKFKLQYNETVKSLQFRKLHRLENESADEWIGRLGVAPAECNYRELDGQLKEQFIHGLSDKLMLDEIIRELTAKNRHEQGTSEGVLIWAKRIEVQRAQAVILNNIMESHQFDKVNSHPKAKGGQCETHTRWDRSMMPLQILWEDPCTKAVSSLWKDM